MRVHACRHCGEVFPSYSDLRQHLDSHASGHKCATCGRAFTRRANLQRHASRCRPTPFVCDVCRRSFTRERDLDRHKRTVQCGSPPQPGPAPKRRRIVARLNEDPVLAPPVEHAANDELSSAIRDAVRENWGSVRTVGENFIPSLIAGTLAAIGCWCHVVAVFYARISLDNKIESLTTPTRVTGAIKTLQRWLSAPNI